MVRLRRAFVVVVVVGAATTAVRTPAAQQVRLADAIIPSNAAIPLSTPTNSLKSLDVLRRILVACGVPFGLEGPALDEPPPFDFGATPVELANLSGMRLGAALDAIARTDASVHWSEHEGVVVVRLGPSPSVFLDGRAGPVTYTGTSLADALAAVAAAVDPGHPRNVGRGGFTVAPMGSAPKTTDSPISLVEPRGTVEHVLSALARQAHGGWEVTYSSADRGASTAAIWLRLSPVMQLVADLPRDRQAAPRESPTQRAFVYSGIQQPLLKFASDAHLTLGFVSLPNLEPVEPFGFALTLDTTKPAESIGKLLRYDSRYQWKESAGVFHVWPKAAIATGLDTPTRYFRAADEPLSALLPRLIGLTGRRTFGQLFVTPSEFRDTVQAQQRRDLPTVPVSAILQDVGTAEDVLDELCRSLEWSWEWRIGIPRHPGFLALRSKDGWTVGWDVNAVPTILQPPSNANRYPATPKDYDIDRVAAVIGGAENDPFRGLLGKAGRQPIGLELEPLASFDDPRVLPASGTVVPLGPGPFSEALATLMDRLPDYSMTTSGGLIDIAPRTRRSAPDHFLNRPIDHFEVHDATIGDAVKALRHRLDPAYPLMKSGETTTAPGVSAEDVQRRAAAAASVFSRRISVSVDHASPREILNRLVLTNQDLRWTIRYESNPVGSPVQPIEEDCIVVLSTYPEIGLSRSFGPMPRPGSGAGHGPGDIPPGPPVAIVLPTDEDTLRTAIGEIARRLEVRVGVFYLSVSHTPGETLAAQAAVNTVSRYNIAGLAQPALFDRLLAGLPAYAWKAADRIVHIEPAALRDAAGSILNRPVEHFSADFRDLNDAASRLADFILGRPLRVTPSAPVNARPGRYDRPFHVALDHGTVRDLLDETVREQGYCSWAVTTADPTLTALNGRGLSLSLIGFDGVSATTSVFGLGR